MIGPICARCKKELMAPGGLVFSPPSDITNEHMEITHKRHVCKKCFTELLKWFTGYDG